MTPAVWIESSWTGMESFPRSVMALTTENLGQRPRWIGTGVGPIEAPVFAPPKIHLPEGDSPRSREQPWPDVEYARGGFWPPSLPPPLC